MKNILAAFAFSLIPMLSMAQILDFKNMMTAEYYSGKDTILMMMSCKTDHPEILDGQFIVFKNRNSYVQGSFKDNKKTGMWYYFNDDMTIADSADYSVIHNIPFKEYDKVYITYEEGMQRPDIGECLNKMNVRYPILNKVKSIQGTVSFQFILNADNEITNIEILKTYNDDMAMEVVFALRNLKFPHAVTLNGEPVNYKITGGIRFNSHDFTSEPEPKN